MNRNDMSSATAAREIDVWCNKARSLETRISQAARDFEYLAQSYPDIRNKTSNLRKTKYNSAKERIDGSYGNVVETKRWFCGMKAGRHTRKTLKALNR